MQQEEDVIRRGGGPSAIERQHKKGRLTARERVARLIDPGSEFFELGLWADVVGAAQRGDAAAGRRRTRAHRVGRRRCRLSPVAVARAAQRTSFEMIFFSFGVLASACRIASNPLSSRIIGER